jgi:phosphate transport system permease protein
MTTAPARIVAKQRPADRIFRGAATFAGSLILVILAAVAIFLIAQSIPAFVVDPSEIKGQPDSFWSYVGPLVFGTVWAAAIALIIAVPLAIGIALFISH